VDLSAASGIYVSSLCPKIEEGERLTLLVLLSSLHFQTFPISLNSQVSENKWQLGGTYSINRQEALSVLHELTQLHKEVFVYAEIMEIREADGTELKIKCPLDSHGRKVITDFLSEKNLQMREEKGYIIIY